MKSKAALWWILPLSLAWACGSSSSGDNTGGGASGQGASSTGASAGSLNLAGDGANAGGDNGTGTGGSLNTGGTLLTGGTGGTTVGTGTTACSDGKDNDGDGLTDGFDPECTGADDNDENSYATGIPGDNRDPKWQDCFFDGNSGAGDDGCRYNTGCLTGDLPPTDKDCKLTAACIKFCAPLTPNGCDCFGCCTVQDGDASVDIMLSATCSLDNVDDEKACPRCTKTDTCGNTCGRCELCPGKTEADLPADCGGSTGTGGAPSTGEGGAATGGGPTYTCDSGEQVCGTNLPGCPLDYYCSLGCCIPKPPR
ncbi:MAG TPA: hypothetical protein VHB79_01550 [Polyangiaceae bacterium]|nr:hypothetical protein [Polyangiaceae bacterium]